MPRKLADPATAPLAQMIVVRRIAAENLPRLLSAPNFRTEPEPPAIERLSRIVAPAPDNLKIASILENGLSRAAKKVIEGAGHLLNLDKPEEFGRIVTDYLDEPGSAIEG